MFCGYKGDNEIELGYGTVVCPSFRISTVSKCSKCCIDSCERCLECEQCICTRGPSRFTQGLHFSAIFHLCLCNFILIQCFVKCREPLSRIVKDKCYHLNCVHVVTNERFLAYMNDAYVEIMSFAVGVFCIGDNLLQSYLNTMVLATHVFRAIISLSPSCFLSKYPLL